MKKHPLLAFAAIVLGFSTIGFTHADPANCPIVYREANCYYFMDGKRVFGSIDANNVCNIVYNGTLYQLTTYRRY